MITLDTLEPPHLVRVVKMKFAYFTTILSFIYLTASCKSRIKNLSRNIDTKQTFVKPINITVQSTGNDDTETSEVILCLFNNTRGLR